MTILAEANSWFTCKVTWYTCDSASLHIQKQKKKTKAKKPQPYNISLSYKKITTIKKQRNKFHLL